MRARSDSALVDTPVLRFALLGAGRIGEVHAGNFAATQGATLACVFDLDDVAARSLAETHRVDVASSVAGALAGVDAVIIATSTHTHVDIIVAAAEAGRAVLCEKPIDLDLGRVEACRRALAAAPVPVQVGFNRRYDPHHRAVREAVAGGEVGRLEMLLITSRDPAPPPEEYLTVSGGLFRDMMIHDFDMARFVLGEEPNEVSALASAVVDPAIEASGDVDTAMVTLRCRSGALCHINNSRRAVYGYDQRIEAFGALGMVRCDNLQASTLTRHDAAHTEARGPLLNFFLERYAESYRAELADFVDAVATGRPPAVGFDDGYRALLLAEAADESLRSGRVVSVS